MTSDKESHLQKLKGAKTIACALSAKIQKKTSLLKNAYIFLLEEIFFFFFSYHKSEFVESLCDHSRKISSLYIE